MVVRLSSDYNDAGVLALCMSITNIFSTIALFNVRNYQVSDINGEFSNSEYSTHRLFTSLLSFVLCAIFALINPYSTYIRLSIIFYMLVKCVEAYCDVLHGMLQKKWRMNIIGLSFILRGSILIISAVICLYYFKSIMIAIIVMSLSTLAVLLVFDLRIAYKSEHFGINVSFKRVLQLSKVCMPLLIYSLCINAIVPFSRYVMELTHDTETLGFYATVSSVAVLIQAFAMTIFTPLVEVCRIAYSEGRKKDLTVIVAKLTVFILLITLLSMGGVFLLGDAVMSLVFGKEILPYVYLLYPTIAASCITAFVWLLGMVLVTMRCMKTMFSASFAGFLISAVLSIALVPERAYFGANFAIISSLLFVGAVFTIRFIIYLKTDNSTKRINE